MNLILMILLGCNVNFLMEDRVNTAANFANEWAFSNQTSYESGYNSVHWFLSGGIKYEGEHAISEAERMAIQVNSYETPASNWEYILDEKSTNTAENLFRAKHYIKHSGMKYSNIYVNTSEFHYTRAKKMVDMVMPYNDFGWILGTKKESTSDYWERVHMKNVEDDILKAFNRFRYIA